MQKREAELWLSPRGKQEANISRRLLNRVGGFSSIEYSHRKTGAIDPALQCFLSQDSSKTCPLTIKSQVAYIFSSSKKTALSSHSKGQSVTTLGIQECTRKSGEKLCECSPSSFRAGRTNRLVDAVVGGWEISPLYVYTQGTPISLGSNWEWNGPIGVKVHDLPVDGNHNYKRLQVLTPCVAYKDTNTGALTYGPSYTANNCTYPLAVQAPNGYAIGRNTVYWGARTGSIHQFDTSLSKHFAWNEKLNVQLRLDAFNVLNHPNFGNGPNTSATSLDFGTVAKNGSTTPTVPSRELQLSGKLIF